MSFEEVVVPSRDLYSLSVRVFDTKNPKAVVLFIHGMEEYQNRYVEFAEFLQKNGYAIVTADMRGHGKNAPKLSHIADKNGHKLLIEDEQVLIEYIRGRFPEVPLMLFGHSMGTIIARKLLQTNSQDFVKVALSGYPNPQGIASIGAALSAFIAIFKGRQGYSKLVNDMVLGGFSKAVPDATSSLDWLSYNKENVDKYAKDPLCGEEFTLGSFNALFHLVSDINKPGQYKNVNAGLPIYLISGADDPCTGGEKGRADSLDRLQRAGFKNIEVKTMDHMRHEILNEDDKQTVMQLILDFLNK